MADATTEPPSQAATTDTYWSGARQPLVSLVFIAPLLLTYEAGVLLLGPDSVRNGADVWLRQLLGAIGLGQYFLLPVLTVGILLSWHHLTRRPWRVPANLLPAMCAECVLLALGLRLLLHVQGILLQVPAEPVSPGAGTVLRNGVGFLGAGIYEELLFRLVLLSVLVWAMRRLGATSGFGVACGIVLSSLIFAGAHYVGAYGEPLHWFSFSFRFLAGTCFSVLFVYRGFGIAVGTHAGYDLLVGLV